MKNNYKDNLELWIKHLPKWMFLLLFCYKVNGTLWCFPAYSVSAMVYNDNNNNQNNINVAIKINLLDKCCLIDIQITLIVWRKHVT